MVLIGGLLFILGIVMGSAANALIDRLPKKESWTKGRSKCDKCRHKLVWQDLIPVYSYLSLGGKCRYCHSPIPLRNLIVELIMGISFVLLGINHILLMGILWVTVIIAVMDWETRLVSEVMIVIWAGLVLINQFPSINNLSGLLIGIGIIGGIWLITSGKGMGEGDIEIAAVMGWWLLREKTIIALWAAFVLGSVISVYQLIKRKSTMKSKIAFGPFLVAGSWIAFVWGERIWRLMFGW